MIRDEVAALLLEHDTDLITETELVERLAALDVTPEEVQQAHDALYPHRGDMK